ncbi:MAG: hypothetical protein K6G80_02265 [Treponema sp.]|nr:hypothetical protein [Treponema sp.]
MSGCPKKDIHSVYVDGELPLTFRAEYESHVASCQTCKAILEKLKAQRKLFAEDNAAASVDGVYLAQSFERLQTKLHYADTVQKAAPQKNIISFPGARWAVSAACAAAVFACIFTPAYLRSRTGATGFSELKAIASAELKPLTEKQVIIDGNISHTDLSSLALAEAKPQSESTTGEAEAVQGETKAKPAEQRTVRATATVGTAGSRAMRRSLTSVDVFKPGVVDAAAQLPIKIETPLPSYGGENR